VSVKIKGVKHEFSTIDNVLEDVIQIILNLKQVRFKLLTNQPAIATISVKGEKEVTAQDIKTGSEAEVVNPEIHIATLTAKKAEFEAELEIEPGLGYVPVEQRRKDKKEIGKIAIDAIFTPIKRVNYSVDNVRVGDRTDYNRLRINIETDGSISPKEAFKYAAKILVDHFTLFSGLEEEVKEKKETKSEKEPKINGEDILKTKIEDLKVSSRTISALIEGGIKTAAGLIKKSESDLKELEGLGPKGIKEIKKALSKLGLVLKEDKE
jgi:DNA-directed RNA polymerase subunit alpha